MHLLQLFPKKQHDPRLVDEFNRRMDIEYERIRDFLILHYHLNGRDDSELWRHCRSMAIPDSLQRRLQLFQHSGIIEQYRDGLFTPPVGSACFWGRACDRAITARSPTQFRSMPCFKASVNSGRKFTTASRKCRNTRPSWHDTRIPRWLANPRPTS